MTARRKNPRRLESKLRWVRNNRDHVNAHQREYWQRPENHGRRIGALQKYSAEQVAKNPTYHRDRSREFHASNPNYARDYYRRKRLRAAWLKFSTICAEGRRALGAIHADRITKARDSAASLEAGPIAHADRCSAAVPMRPTRRAYEI